MARMSAIAAFLAMRFVIVGGVNEESHGQPKQPGTHGRLHVSHVHRSPPRRAHFSGEVGNVLPMALQ
jgi:hypothetical protein